jgi:hypothetical protein
MNVSLVLWLGSPSQREELSLNKTLVKIVIEEYDQINDVISRVRQFLNTDNAYENIYVVITGKVSKEKTDYLVKQDAVLIEPIDSGEWLNDGVARPLVRFRIYGGGEWI